MSRKAEPSYKTENNPFSKKLREIMKERHTTQKQLAEVIKMRPQTVSLYMNGQSLPDVLTLKRIADFFDVSADWLLEREGSIRSTDGNMESACKYTGLHEKAIEMISMQHPQCRANFLFEETSYKFYLLLLSRFIAHNFYYRNEIFQGCNDAIMYHLKALEVLWKAKESGSDLATMQKAREDALDNIDKSEYAKYIAEKGIRKWIDSEIKSLEAGDGFEKAMRDLVECMESNEEFRKKMHSCSWLTDEEGGGKDGEHPETDN